MAGHRVKLKSRQEIAEGTMAFHFEKPPGFAFKAGQALAWTLIDPRRSMPRQAAEQKLPHHLFLFYSNRRPEDAAFLEELEGLEKESSNYKFIGTMTGMARSSRIWRGETGFINREMLTKYIVELSGPIYYAARPPKMVAAMQQMLSEAGVNSDDVRAEEFAGY